MTTTNNAQGQKEVINVEPIAEMLSYNGNYGEYGGAFVPPVLAGQLEKLSNFFDEITKIDDFKNEFIQILKDFVGRPTSLYFAKNLSDYVGSNLPQKRRPKSHGFS